MAKKVEILKDMCIGCGACAATCPDLFQIGDDGKAEPIVPDVPEDVEASAEQAAQDCPAQAIVIK
jgi:ferredoxin